MNFHITAFYQHSIEWCLNIFISILLWTTPHLLFSTVVLFYVPILPCLWLCLPFQTQTQPRTVEPGKECATTGSSGVPPSLPPSPPSTLISIPCTPLAKQGSCSLGWCSLGSQPDPHHIPTLCQDALLGGKEKASPAGCRRGKQLRGGFLSSSSRDLWNALNWFSKYSVSHWSSKHIYMLPALCTLNFIADKKF